VCVEVFKVVRKPVLAIGGPTASGKSGLAIEIAKELNGVVINYDSIQLYAGLPILTAQPNNEDLILVPHRLYSVLEPEAESSAAFWRSKALEEIAKAHSENKLPILVGGSGFYLKSIIEGLSPIPDVPKDIRLALSKKLEEIGIDNFYKEFKNLDNVMAEKLDPCNSQRITRAWEVLEFTGKSLSSWQKEPLIKAPMDIFFKTLIIIPDREKLYKRCNSRFEEMVSNGAIDEAEEFRVLHGNIDIPLNKALGYKILCDYIDKKISREDAMLKSQATTRNYAKRQVTWFKNQVSADFLTNNPKDSLHEILSWINN